MCNQYGCLGILTVAGEFQHLKPHSPAPVETKQVGHLHQLWGDEGHNDVEEPVPKVHCSPEPQVFVVQGCHRGGADFGEDIAVFCSI
eukprot:Em0005g367a